MTTETYLNPKEAAFLLPVLERILNGVATQRLRKRPDFLSPFAPPVYGSIEELFSQILSCRNKLRRIGRSGKLRLNAFELAALALSFRVTFKEKLSAELIKPADLNHLKWKLEILRKRAKRSWIRVRGADSFTRASLHWQQLVASLRFEIIAPPNRRLPSLKGLSMLAREHRDLLRIIARDVTVAGADAMEIQHLADLARHEVRRRRHPFTMRDLAKDPVVARNFIANFILKRKGPEVLKHEYVPKPLQMSKFAKSFRAALTATTPDPKLVTILAGWIEREIDPGFYDDVRKEINYQLGFLELHRIPVTAKGVRRIISGCKPEFTYQQDDLCSFWAVWATRWLLALEPDENKLFPILAPAFAEAKARWNKFTPESRRRKLNEMIARYPCEDPNSRRLHPFAA